MKESRFWKQSLFSFTFAQFAASIMEECLIDIGGKIMKRLINWLAGLLKVMDESYDERQIIEDGIYNALVH